MGSFRLLGKACFCAGRLAESEQAYQRARGLNAEGVAAWKGLVELHSKTGNQSSLAEAYGKLVSSQHRICL